MDASARPTIPNLSQMLEALHFWDGEQRKNYRRGGALPSVVFDFTPPFLFDCGFTTERRMGIGDQLCLVSAIQGVADRVGWKNVHITYDPDYPGSHAVFDMSGLRTIPPDKFRAAWREWSIIPCRQHLFESPVGNVNCGYYAEDAGSPVAQVYWNLGWHGLFRGYPIRLKLFPDRGAASKAQEIAAQYAPFITANPLEVSRLNSDCTVAVWRDALARIENDFPLVKTILFGGGPKDYAALDSFVSHLNLTRRHAIILEPLPVWKYLIDLASAHVTGNNCGMWLSFASATQTFLLQHDDPGHLHNSVWNLKTNWDCRNISLIKV